jgi:hypothetical protein
MHGNNQASATYVIPARTLSGTPRDVVEELDQFVESLLAFRQVVASEHHGSVRVAPRQNGSPPTAR